MAAGCVVHVSNLPVQAQEADLLEALSQFGSISYVQLREPGIALVEFEDVASAQEGLNAAMQGSVFIMSQPLYLSPSQMENIQRAKLESTRPTNVLVMYIKNILPGKIINVKVIRTICDKISPCLRIAIHREEETFALVEFSDAGAAHRVKQKLNGCDIYAGCCTLKVDFAKLTFVKIKPDNPNDNWDSSLMNNGAADSGATGRPRYALLEGMDADDGGYPPLGRGAEFGGIGGGRGFGANMYDPYAAEDDYSYGGMPQPLVPRGGGLGRMPPPSMMPMEAYGPVADGTGRDMEGGVVIGFGFAENVTCDHIFNIFCLYGNVARVMFLRNKPDSCLIQMGDSVAAKRVLHFLARFRLFGKAVTVRPSTQGNYITPVSHPAERADGSSSYAEYTSNRENRYLTPETAMKNRLPNVSHTLYFFNCPIEMDLEEVASLFTDAGAAKPRVQLFPNKQGEGTKVCAGLAEFETEEDAMNALALANNTKIDHPSSKFPFCFKLSFVSNKNDPSGGPEPEGGGYPAMMGGFGGGGGGMGFDEPMPMRRAPPPGRRPGGMRRAGGIRGGRMGGGSRSIDADDVDFDMTGGGFGGPPRGRGNPLHGVRGGRISKSGRPLGGRGRGGRPVRR